MAARTKSSPDLELKCKVGEYTDVVAIDLKNPDGSYALSDEQDTYLKQSEQTNQHTYTK